MHGEITSIKNNSLNRFQVLQKLQWIFYIYEKSNGLRISKTINRKCIDIYNRYVVTYNPFLLKYLCSLY
jgi:hypothetical protein